ncbi:MAG TPA: hypothetical protein VMH88_02735 [Gemmatimonadales bacterium]|nr:hypothetical protein [Gemmatimonadales bacterium]
MRDIGPIERLQIQRGPLKTGEKPDRAYSPAPLLPVSRLALGPDGALGAGPDGTWIVDVHHRAHPLSRHDAGQNGVSVGFTGHYTAMRERFGDRIAVGCAGENIIAAATGVFRLQDVQHGLAIVAPDGRERVRLRVNQVAHPCRPFTGWALGARVDPEALKGHLQFLDDGMRGYYCSAEGAGVVEVGDLLVAV